jgi:biopolymer transport protein ExbB
MGITLALQAPLVFGQDMRQLQTRARDARQALVEKAEAEKRAAEQAAAESRARIAADRDSLQRAVAELETEVKQLEAQGRRLSAKAEALARAEGDLGSRLSETDSVVREMVGVVRTNAKDIDALVSQSLQTAFLAEDIQFLQDIASESRFPDMGTMERMASTLLATARGAGEVAVRQGRIVDRAGRQSPAEVLTIGDFTAAYRTADEVGFLGYSAASRSLYALSRLPSRSTARQIAAFMDGRSDSVPMDISRGGALRQLIQHVTFWQRIPQGGPIGWIIVATFGAGLLIVIERLIAFRRKSFDGQALLDRIEALAAERNWEACKEACRRHVGKPLARVLMAGLEGCRLQREELENVLQEAILREVPSLERFLSTLGMLAAIAPLLGLLGTVTGMINTFHVITMHGAGDPRLMSAGISEALVTTMLGLITAIPFLFVHTLLSRRADTAITQMEEKAVALVNIVQKNGGCDA